MVEQPRPLLRKIDFSDKAYILNILNEYRTLDFDDLILCSLLSQKISRGQIATYLSLTPPAVCNRLKKFRGIWPNMFVIDEKRKNYYKITDEGIEICKKMKEIICCFVKSTS